MKKSELARSTVSMKTSYGQCFLCREWSWSVCRAVRDRTLLCLPCYVDVLEMRQARGVIGEGKTLPAGTPDAEMDKSSEPGNSPSPLSQLEMFD